MKTLVISGRSPLPGALRDVVERGSTVLEERRASELQDRPAHLDADRIVFWAAADDAVVRELAQQYARAEAAERKEKLVFVTPEPPHSPPAGLSATELFVWPRDEDRLKMAFLTGA